MASAPVGARNFFLIEEYALRNNALDAEGCTVLEAGSAVPLVIRPVATAVIMLVVGSLMDEGQKQTAETRPPIEHMSFE
jgi:hypothetical protein